MTSLNSDQLDAFEAVARTRKFGEAAKLLALSQPALSRRIQALEFELGQTLLTRSQYGAELTEPGRRLFEFIRSRRALEEDLREELGGEGQEGVGGMMRIAGYSTILHSLVAPAIAPWLRKNTRAQIYFSALQGVRREKQAWDLVQRAEVDFLIGTASSKLKAFDCHYLGKQRLVGIESRKYGERKNTFLDSRPEDNTTERFFAANPDKKADFERSFLHDEEGILNGVSLGLGRAVVFSSMLNAGLPIRKLSGWKSLTWNLYLVYRKQPVYPKLFKEMRETLLRELPKLLS